MFALQSQFRGNSEGDVVFRQVFKGRSYFDAVAHVVEQRVVDWLADVAHGPLHVARGDDLVGARGVLVCGQDADLATRHLLLVNVHSLHSEEKEDKLSCWTQSIYTVFNKIHKTFLFYPERMEGHF